MPLYFFRTSLRVGLNYFSLTIAYYNSSNYLCFSQDQTSTNMSQPVFFKAVTKHERKWMRGMPTLTQTGAPFMFPCEKDQHTVQYLPETLCQFTGVYGRPLYHPDDFDDIDDPDEVKAEPLFLGDIIQIRDWKRFKVLNEGVVAWDENRYRLWVDGDDWMDILPKKQGSIMFDKTLWIVGNVHTPADCELDFDKIEFLKKAVWDKLHSKIQVL